MTIRAAETGRLRRRGFRLEYATMTWMAAEAAVAITAGLIAASVALVGFGLDSVIELFSAAIVIGQLRGEIAGQDRQTRAVRLIGVTFFALAAYLIAESTRDLAAQDRPEQSAAGLAVTAAALVVMPALAVAKRRTGQALGNRTLVADSAETAFCAFTSAAALLGVGLDAWFGWWWWADTLANGTAVTSVGYGAQNFAVGGGPCGGPCKPRVNDVFTRFFGTSKLIASNDRISAEFVKLSANPAQGKGGTCFGDSGGPNLLDNTSTILSVNSFVTNGRCNGVTYSFRIDTTEALSFIHSIIAAHT